MNEPGIGEIYGRWLKKVWRRPGRTAIIVFSAIVLLTAGGGGIYAAIFGGSGTQSSTSDIDLQKGLIDWWKLNGNLKDSSPYANDGTNHSATLSTDRKGTSNYAYAFSGSSQYISTANSVTLPMNSFAVAAWFKTTATGDQKIISNNTSYHQLQTFTGGKLRVCINGCSAGSTTISDGNWHLAVAVGDGTSIRVYLDGSATPEITQTAASTNMTGTINIGAVGNGSPSLYFNGSIDDVRIYNRALSTSEVSALYKSYDPALGAASGESNMVGWWKLDGDTKDATPNANDLTNNASATTTTDRKGMSTSAYAFTSASSQYLSHTVNSSSKLNMGTNDWSVSAWIKSTTTGVDRGIAGTWTGSNAYWYFRIDTANKLLLRLQATGGTPTASFNSTGTIADSNWHQVGFSASRSGNVTFYIDGSPSGTADISAFNGLDLTNSSSEFDIGSIGNHLAGFFFNGSIDDVRIYKKALSGTDMSNIYKAYNSQVSANYLSKALAGDWAFNGNAKDSTPYANNGTVTAATLTTDRKGRSNSAYSFDGTVADYISIPNLSVSSGSFSVAGWVYHNSQSNYGTFVGYDTSHRILIQNSSGLLLTQFGGNFFSTGAVPFDTWTYITYTYDSTGNTEYFYINGAYDSQHTPSSAPTWNSAFKVGQYDLVNYPYKGSIDDVRVWKRALSATEIMQAYNTYR